MDQVCRLCLTRSIEFTELSQESEIHRKIQRCLNMHITIETWLPKAVCTICMNKIEYIQEYQNFVATNQDVLKCSLNQIVKAPVELNTHIDELSKNSTPKLETEVIIVKDEAPTLSLNDGIKEEYDFDASFDSEETSRDSDNTPKSVKKAAVNSQVVVEQNENEKKENIVQINIEMKLFKCLTCFVMFEKQNELVKHYNQEHYEIQGNHVINNFVRERDNGTLTYRCKECNKVCDSKKIINRHMITHSEDRPFVCKLCGRAYKTAWHIVYHGRVHREYKMTCSYNCGFSTVYQGALTQHEKLHRTEFKFKCKECGKGFQVRTCYEQHQNIHNGVRPFKCDICGSAFHIDSYLQAHKAKVHPQTSNVKRFVCVHCSLRCDSKNSLTLHLKEHGIKTSFLCDTCGKTLSSAVQLKLHKTLHLGVKPFSCSTCNKNFAKKSNLTLHLQTHARSRSYSCACGKKYSRHAALRRHCLQARHAPESVNCPKCNKLFPSQFQLATHKKTCT